MMIKLGALFLLISVSFALEKVFVVMGTYAVIELEKTSDIYRAHTILKEIESKLSDYREDSEISKINKNAGLRSIGVSPMTREVILQALEISRETWGYFDISIGSLSINHKRKGTLDKDKALSLVNYKEIELKEDKVFLKRKGMAIDLGGIGKGFALKVLKRKLKTPKGFVGIAGDMAVWGMKKIFSIKDPLKGGILAQIVNKEDICLSTSGNYIKEHISQRDKSLVQITVVHRDCAKADAYATALFSMPLELRRKFLERNKEVGVLELYKDGSLFMNEKFRKMFEPIIIKADM